MIAAPDLSREPPGAVWALDILAREVGPERPIQLASRHKHRITWKTRWRLYASRHPMTARLLLTLAAWFWMIATIAVMAIISWPSFDHPGFLFGVIAAGGFLFFQLKVQNYG